MFWRWLMIFGTASCVSAVFFLLNAWHLKCAEQKAFFGGTFSSYWTFLFFWTLMIMPVTWAANYLLFSLYYHGYKVWTDVFHGKFWIITLTNSAASYMVLLFMTWLCFGEWPSKGTLAGLVLVIAAVLVSIFWK